MPESDTETVKVRVYESDRERINALRQGNEGQADVVRGLLEGAKVDAEDESVETIGDALGDDELAIIGREAAVVDELADRLMDGDADLPDYVRDQLDRIESAATTAEERTNQLETLLEELQR